MTKVEVRPKGRDHFLIKMERSDTTTLGTLVALRTLVTFKSDVCKAPFRGNSKPGLQGQDSLLFEHKYIERFFYGRGGSDENDAIID